MPPPGRLPLDGPGLKLLLAANTPEKMRTELTILTSTGPPQQLDPINSRNIKGHEQDSDQNGPIDPEFLPSKDSNFETSLSHIHDLAGKLTFKVRAIAFQLGASILKL